MFVVLLHTRKWGTCKVLDFCILPLRLPAAGSVVPMLSTGKLGKDLQSGTLVLISEPISRHNHTTNK